MKLIYTFLLLLLLLLGFGSKNCAAWTFELSKQSGDQATLNKVWCASPTGDSAFGPVQGTDTSAPDASIWAATQPIDDVLLQLRLPSLDYSCLLEVQGSFSSPPSLWSFSLPLLAMDEEEWITGDIKCDISGEDIPPLCQLFDSDNGYAVGARPFTVSSLTIEQSKTTAPAPASPSTGSSSSTDDQHTPTSSSSMSSAPPAPSSPSTPAPAPAPSSDSISSIDDQRTPTSSSSMSSAPSPYYTPSSNGDSGSSNQPPSPANTPAPARKLLSLKS